MKVKKIIPLSFAILMFLICFQYSKQFVTTEDPIGAIFRAILGAIAVFQLAEQILAEQITDIMEISIEDPLELAILGIKTLRKQYLRTKNNLQEKYTSFNFDSLELISALFENISPKTWKKTSDCFLDILETFPDEISLWEKRNLKFIAYLVLTIELAGFFYYFTRTAISNAIATRRISS